MPELLKNPTSDMGRYFNIQEGCATNVFPLTYNLQDYDNEPDQYYYSLPNGQSGKFILTRSREILLAKDELIDITHVVEDNNISKWKFKTPDGFIYDFEEHESYIDDKIHNSAWYLTKITSPTKKVVLFEYTTSSAYIRTVGAFTEVMNLGGTPTSGSTFSCPGTSFYSGQAPGRQYTNVQLEKISFDQGYIKFFYSPREDLVNDQKLHKMEVYDTISDPGTIYKIKRFDFSYEYFQGTSDQISGDPSDTESKRLKLKKIDILSSNDEKGSNYFFEYHNETNLPSTLPSKLSFARDHWGYYNGRNGNQMLIPSFTNYDSPDPVKSALGIMGNERDSNKNYMTLFSLRKIWYPTGGYTELELEAHDFDVDLSGVADNSYFNNDEEVILNSSNINYSSGDPRNSSGHGFPENFTEAQQATKVLDFTNAYVPTGASTFHVELNCFFRFNSSLSFCPAGNETVTFELISQSGYISYSNIFQSIPGYGKCSGIQTQDPQQDEPPYSGISYKRGYDLIPGKYFVRLYIQPGANLIVDYAFTFSYLAPQSNIVSSTGVIKYLAAGGLRVKRVLTYESPTAEPQITRYDYHYTTDTNNDGILEEYSYGRRMVKPNYSYFERGGGTDDLFSFQCDFLKRGSESITQLSSTSVGYDQVTVYHGEHGLNGKTVYEYHNLPDLVLDYTQYSFFLNTWTDVPRRPPGMSTIPNALNGMVKKQTDYACTGLYEFSPTRIITNNYVDKRSQQDPTIWAVQVRNEPVTGILNCAAAQTTTRYGFYFYPALTRTWIVLESTIEETFDQINPLSSTEVTVENTYNPNNFQLIRKDQYWPSKRLITTYKYPQDYTSAQCTPAMLAMKNLQSVFYSPVIQTRMEQEIGSTRKVIGQEVTLFDYASNNSMILPTASASFLLNEPQTPSNVPDFIPTTGVTNNYKINYQIAYNNLGKIETITKPNDAPVSYIWGYQNSAPIAKVTNALPQQVYYNSFEDPGEGNASYFKTGKYSYQLSSGTLTKNLPSGRYKLQYWAKGDVSLTGGIITNLYASAPDENNWIFYVKDITLSSSANVQLSGNSATYVDEVRIFPADAQITTYTYLPLIGISSATDTNGITTYYDYDTLGRLMFIKDQDGNIVKRYSYGYRDKGL